MKSNASVKRILRELRELATTSNPDIAAVACEDELFEWIFAIRGAWGSEFEGGIYVGRIHMPAEYPFKPPGFTMLTPSGRFEINTKICLSISSYHPESWQPSWSVESALVALIAFMQTEGGGAIGSMDCPKEDRRAMAAESRVQGPRVGCPIKQALVDSLHAKLMGLEEESRKLVREERDDEKGGEMGGEKDGRIEEVEREEIEEIDEREEKDESDGLVGRRDDEERLRMSAGHHPGGASEIRACDERVDTATASRVSLPSTSSPALSSCQGVRATTTDEGQQHDQQRIPQTTNKANKAQTTTILMTSAITIFLLWHLVTRIYSRRQAQSQLDASLSYSWTSPDIIPELVDDTHRRDDL